MTGGAVLPESIYFFEERAIYLLDGCSPDSLQDRAAPVVSA